MQENRDVYGSVDERWRCGRSAGQTLFDRGFEAIKPLAPTGRNNRRLSTTTVPNYYRWALSHMYPKKYRLSNARCGLEGVG